MYTIIDFGGKKIQPLLRIVHRWTQLLPECKSLSKLDTIVHQISKGFWKTLIIYWYI